MREKFKAEIKNKKFKDIYLYPSGEDARAASIILEKFKEHFAFNKIIFLDDAKEETSLRENGGRIAQNGELWIVHQDSRLYEMLLNNAKILPKEIVFNGIARLEEGLFAYLQNTNINEIIKAHENEDNEALMPLNYFGYFVLQFWITLQKNNVFVKVLKDFTAKLSAYFKEYFKIPKHCVGVVVTPFSGNQHLGKIGIYLEKMGINVIYVYYSSETFSKIPPNPFLNKDSRAIIFPLQVSYLGKLLNVFELFVTCQMPITSPQWGTKMIYVSHAYIDPIASLAQRKRPLDDFWFLRKMGICGYRIVPSLSNYQIYEEKFKEYGFQEELVCGGYPSLDSSIKEYEKECASLDVCGGGGVLIAINDVEILLIIEEFLKIQKKSIHKNKIYFRPHPGTIAKQESEKLAKKYAQEEWFVYDDTNRLSPRIMRECCCIIGDYSSLVYTFPLTTLKPAILLFRDKTFLENSYKNVSFYNPILHKIAQNAKEISKRIKEILKENAQDRAEMILQYRKKEVFNLGKSSEFIADFVFKMLKKD